MRKESRQRPYQGPEMWTAAGSRAAARRKRLTWSEAANSRSSATTSAAVEATLTGKPIGFGEYAARRRRLRSLVLPHSYKLRVRVNKK